MLPSSQPVRLAVIGSGIAGMASAFLLDQHHPEKQYQVTLIEKNPTIGGHTNTVEVIDPDDRCIGVDTGFIVYNEPNYPHLTGLLHTLSVATQTTDMSFGVSIDKGRLEYAGDNLLTLFAQKRNLLKPSFLRMVKDIVRFNRDAKALLHDVAADDLSLGDFLDRGRYADTMHQHYLLPMAAAIWSCPPQQMRTFPAISFARFFNNHGLLDLRHRPQWQTVVDGSHQYVKKLMASFTGEVLLDNPAKLIERAQTGVKVTLANGHSRDFDQVVIATHADQALQLLQAPSLMERTLLSQFSYQDNAAFLHTDSQLMPRLRKVWSSWNYLSESKQHKDTVAVTYWMNRLQQLPTTQDYFVSLNPPKAPAENTILQRINYSHPIFDCAAMDAQKRLHDIQGEQHTWFAGSYFGYGFHEDALRSAVTVAQQLGARIPWLPEQQKGPMHRRKSDR